MLKQKYLLIATILVATALVTGCSSDENTKSEKSTWKPDQEVIVINGHTLPPEPDPAVNNATLLGVDSNGNGVRDDVERWIYTTYDKPIEQAVLMQSARAYQVVIQEPEKALDNLPIMQAATRCESYWSFRAKRKGESFWLEEYKDYEKEINPIQFNTADRFLAYKKYNQILSGGVYSGDKLETWKDKCDFNSSNLVKTP